MKVYVKVFASLRKRYPGVNDLNPLVLDILEGTSVEELILKLEFNLDEIKIILINGIKVSPDYTIKEEDTISFFPAIGGG